MAFIFSSNIYEIPAHLNTKREGLICNVSIKNALLNHPVKNDDSSDVKLFRKRHSDSSKIDRSVESAQ